MTEDPSAIRVCPIKDIVCSTPNTCELYDAKCRLDRAPDTQVAPSPPPRPTDDHLWDQTLRERDEAVDAADDLANAIAQHLGVEIGEHSTTMHIGAGVSHNSPWQNALEALRAIPSPPVAPDSLVARLSLVFMRPGQFPIPPEVAELLSESILRIEQLQRERDQAHDAVQRLTNGEPYDRILTAHAIANGIEMYMRRAEAAESRLERVTQAADAMRARLSFGWSGTDDGMLIKNYDAIRAEKDS